MSPVPVMSKESYKLEQDLVGGKLGSFKNYSVESNPSRSSQQERLSQLLGVPEGHVRETAHKLQICYSVGDKALSSRTV